MPQPIAGCKAIPQALAVNRVALDGQAWRTISIERPSLIIPASNPTGHIYAHPGEQPANGITYALQDLGGILVLSSPGDWALYYDVAATIQLNVVDACNPVIIDFYRRRGSPLVTHTAVTVGVASGQALAANVSRSWALFMNDSNNTIYLFQGGTAALNTGIRLNPNGGSYWVTDENYYSGVFNAIATAASSTLLVTEGG